MWAGQAAQSPLSFPCLCYLASPFTLAWAHSAHFVGAPKKGLLPFTTKDLFLKATVASWLDKWPKSHPRSQIPGLMFLSSLHSFLSFFLLFIGSGYILWVVETGCPLKPTLGSTKINSEDSTSDPDNLLCSCQGLLTSQNILSGAWLDCPWHLGLIPKVSAMYSVFVSSSQIHTLRS